MKRSIRLFCVSILIMAAAFGLYSAQQDLKQKLRDRDRDRWMWQLPRQVMNKIGVQPGMAVADVGAGDGYDVQQNKQNGDNHKHRYIPLSIQP